MSSAARERGHYSADRLDAGWLDAAVEMLGEEAE
jgi:hypothetical protein